MTKPAMLFVALSVLGATLPLCADENLKPPAESRSTQQFDIAPGGLIRVNASYGDLYVEAWDQPQVEMTVTKFMPFEYALQHPERATRHMEAVHVTAEKRSPSELAISTTVPPHFSLKRPIPAKSLSDVRIEYNLHVPRNSRLAIHHGVGLVSVQDVTGDIEATCHRGDIVLWLPEAGTYSVDAKSHLGKVYSDFPGSSFSHFLVGQKFDVMKPAPAQKLRLRVGFGGITLKPMLPESEAKHPLPPSTK